MKNFMEGVRNDTTEIRKEEQQEDGGYRSLIACVNRNFVLWGIHFRQVRNE